jgi:hypothetical protein
MTMPWDDIFAFNVDTAERFLIERGEVLPMFAFFNTDREAKILPAPFTNDKEKQAAYGLAHTIAIASKAVAVCCINEAYINQVIKAEGETQMEAALRTVRSNKQAGTEVVSVTFSWREGETRKSLQSLRPIQRNSAGKAIGLGEDIMENAKPTGGDLFDILPEKEPSEQACEHAREMLKLIGLREFAR